jgi:hypothetical protein
MSGHTNDIALDADPDSLQKPFETEALVHKVRKALDRPALTQA